MNPVATSLEAVSGGSEWEDHCACRCNHRRISRHDCHGLCGFWLVIGPKLVAVYSDKLNHIHDSFVDGDVV